MLKEPWKEHAAYRQTVEYLPLSFVKQFLGNGLRGGEEKLAILTEDIEQNGFKTPLTLVVGQQDKKVYLGEGNHRFEVARRLQLDVVPVYVALYKKAGDAISGYDTVVYPFITPKVSELDRSEMYRPSNIFESMTVLYHRIGSIAIRLNKEQEGGIA